MIIGVSPFSEAVPGKSSLESLHSKSYAILLGLRVPRTKVPPSTYGSPSVALHRETSIANPFYISHVNREILDLRAWNFSPTEIFFSPSRLQISSCKIIIKKKKKTFLFKFHAFKFHYKENLSYFIAYLLSKHFDFLSSPFETTLPIPNKETKPSIPVFYRDHPQKGIRPCCCPATTGTRLIRVSVSFKGDGSHSSSYTVRSSFKKNKTDISSSQRGWYFFRTTNNSLATYNSLLAVLQRFLFLETVRRGDFLIEEGGKGRKKREWRRRKRTKEKLELDE